MCHTFQTCYGYISFHSQHANMPVRSEVKMDVAEREVIQLEQVAAADFVCVAREIVWHRQREVDQLSQ